MRNLGHENLAKYAAALSKADWGRIFGLALELCGGEAVRLDETSTPEQSPWQYGHMPVDVAPRRFSIAKGLAHEGQCGAWRLKTLPMAMI